MLYRIEKFFIINGLKNAMRTVTIKKRCENSDYNLHSLFIFFSPFIATYLQLDNAQKMFPCMDEPPYKATFKLSVLYPKGLTARTNTPTM